MATQEEQEAAAKQELDNAKQDNPGNQDGEKVTISKDDVGDVDFLSTDKSEEVDNVNEANTDTQDGGGQPGASAGAESGAPGSGEAATVDSVDKKENPSVVPDTDEKIEDESTDEEKAVNSANSVKQYVIIKSKKHGVIFAQPAVNSGKRESGKSIVAQEGYSEVEVTVWEAVRTDMLALGVKEFGRSTTSGKVITKPFNQFSVHEQTIIASQCNDTKTLNRWKTLPNIDAAVMTVITEKLVKITDYKPVK